MTRKKNRFWTFCFSLFPGAGEMYMGFMKMGVSLMSIFILILAIAVVLGIGPILFVGVVVWFYSFFHVNNLASLPDEEFYAVEDTYIIHLEEEFPWKNFVRAYRKIIAVVLILIGIQMLWSGLFSVLTWYLPEWMRNLISNIIYRVPNLIVGIAIILLGIYMIRGKKEKLEKEEIEFETIRQDTAPGEEKREETNHGESKDNKAYGEQETEHSIHGEK